MDMREVAERNKILEVRAGSNLYGTDTPESDEDFVGVFMPGHEQVFGIGNECGSVSFDKVDKDAGGRNTKDAIDRKLYEYRNFARLALKNNPNILELLFADKKNIVYRDEWGETLMEMASEFPYMGCVGSFVGYARSQLRKMRIKPENWAELMEGLERLNQEDPKDTLGAIHRDPDKMSEYLKPTQEGNLKHLKIGDVTFEANVYVSRAMRILEERLSKATNRAQLYTKYGYDVKFGSHLVRLLREGIELVETGRLIFPLQYADEVLAVKFGEYTVEHVIARAEELEKQLDAAKEKSPLPKKPRYDLINRFVRGEVGRFVFDEKR